MLRLKKPAGLSLIIPYRVSYQAGIDFVYSKSDWIESYKSHFHQTPYTPYYLGEPVNIQYYKPAPHQPQYYMTLYTDRITLEVTELTDTLGIETAYPNILRQLAPGIINPLCEEVSALTGLRANKITYRKMTGRWGRCTAQGDIAFSTLLIQFSIPIIRYVVIHEYCHLLQMNHSPRFWALVEKYCPDYKTLKKKLLAGNYK